MIGIDGCKTGWCVVQDVSEQLRVSIISHISELEKIRSEGEQVFIDMPIGLPDSDHPRNVEQIARKVLPSKSSSFFGVPCRSAVYAKDYKKANAINKAQLEKGLSIQSWHICSKIKEVDIWLRDTHQQDARIIEAHPELCFHFLQKENEFLISKKTAEGRTQRLAILSSWQNGIKNAYEEAMSNYKRKDVAADDILDAMCMWCVANLSQSHQLQAITNSSKDQNGLLMNMYYVDPFEKLTSNYH